MTPPVVLLAHGLAALPHEFAHRFRAWAPGVPRDPLAIDRGGTSLADPSPLIHVDEGLGHPALPAERPGWRVALIAFAGPGIASGGLTIRARRPLAGCLLCRFVVMSLAHLRLLADAGLRHGRRAAFPRRHGMVALRGPDPGGQGAAASSTDHHAGAPPRVHFGAPGARAALTVGTTLILLGYFALPGVLAGEGIPRFVGISSPVALPAAIWSGWPSRPGAAGRMARIRAAASQQSA